MKKVYINPKQEYFLKTNQTNKRFIGGRGSGKTTTIGFHNFNKMKHLPGGKNVIAGLTYNQLLNNTLPPMEKAWRSIGLIEHTNDSMGHYTIGIKPPSHFRKPIEPPRKYENIISFINGYCIHLASLDRPETVRGVNADALDVDEMALIKKDVFMKILSPLVRGNIYTFNHHLHHSIAGFSSMPWMASGQWILEAKELSEIEPQSYTYIEASAYDNIDILGQKYIDNLKLTMTDLEFRVEIMNEPVTMLPNGFYPDFDADKHCDYSNFSYDYSTRGMQTSGRIDYDKSIDIDVSFDFNSAFNSATCWQDKGHELRCLNEFYVKDYKTFIPLVDKICEYYDALGHKSKHINIYGDRNGNNRQANSEFTFYQEIRLRFESLGWSCELHVSGLDSEHKMRHMLINTLFREADSNLPKIRFSQTHCKFTIISIQNAPILKDFKKDKRSERHAIDQERATHLSDTVDNYLYTKTIGRFGGTSNDVGFDFL